MLTRCKKSVRVTKNSCEHVFATTASTSLLTFMLLNSKSAIQSRTHAVYTQLYEASQPRRTVCCRLQPCSATHRQNMKILLIHYFALQVARYPAIGADAGLIHYRRHRLIIISPYLAYWAASRGARNRDAEDVGQLAW